MKIDLTTTPTSEDAEFISKGLVQFNHTQAPDLEAETSPLNFSVFARNDEDVIIGGLRAVCFWNTLHVELLWVSEPFRNTGIGTDLLKKAEGFALHNGYELALLESTSWQARSFYEKLGYKLMGTIPEYPRGYATHFLVKDLT